MVLIVMNAENSKDVINFIKVQKAAIFREKQDIFQLGKVHLLGEYFSEAKNACLSLKTGQK